MKWFRFACVGLVSHVILGQGAAFAALVPDENLMPHRLFFYAEPVETSEPGQANTPELPTRNKARKCRRDQQITGLLKKYDHALKRYLHSKARTILEANTFRVKDGSTLSHFFDDYQNYKVIIRTQDRREFPILNQAVRKNFYIWKEDDQIVMASKVMLMSQELRDARIQKAMSKARPQWAFDEFQRVAEVTRRVGANTPFRLDCQHKAELEGLVTKAVADLRAQGRKRVISPRTFDKLLTILRAYITFNYYKGLSVTDFDERFRELGHTQGRGKWTHQKLTRLLGLHVLGRIESNRGFQKTYAQAIDRAARQTPEIPRKWIEEIIWIETKGDPMTISRAGAYGLMQLMPLVYIGMGEKKSRQTPLSFARTINPFNADQNIERGTYFLAKLQEMLEPHVLKYDRHTRKKILFHAYNCGITRVISLLKKHGAEYTEHLPDETKAYLDKLADFPTDLSKRASAE